MGVVYLAALIFGLGTIALQFVMGGDGDAEADVDADLGADADLDLDADADVDAGGSGDAGEAHHTGHIDKDLGFLPIFLSLRFWTFGLLAFGLTGALLHFLRLASGGITAILASVMFLLAGFLASWSIRALSRAELSSGADRDDAVGQIGRVLLPCDPSRRGKVRIQLRGQTLDLIASTDETALGAGDYVLIEEVRGNGVHVSRAPSEFLPPRKT